MIEMDESIETAPVVPSGVYGNDGSVKIVTSKLVPIDREDPDGGKWWDIAAAIPSPTGLVFAHTQRFGAHNTQLVPGARSKALAFAKQLGVSNPKSFDEAEILGSAVVVEVSLRQYTDKSGAARESVEIVNLHKLA